MKIIHKTAYVLVIIGALNWGLVGLFSIDLINMIFDSSSMIARLIYTVVGLSGLYMIISLYMHTCSHNCSSCSCDSKCVCDDKTCSTCNSGEKSTEESVVEVK